ncbi:MAG: SMC-Scp complex subunit ScpB [Candidatus Chloroheliales bacterium]|nr:MAG: SMC-Scp complex subunit ScpB [Chloroflexota bacterium]
MSERRRQNSARHEPEQPHEVPISTLLEALLFVASEPLTIAALAKALMVTMREAEDALISLQDELVTRGRGLRVQRSGEQVQMVSAPLAAPVVARLLGVQANTRLSEAALETLALIAYRQPVTRAAIEAVRGVDSGGVVNTLLARGLIEEVGRLETAGRPILYATTTAFLRYFGLSSLQELPSL